MGDSEDATPEAYVLSLLAEGKHRAAFEVIPQFGSAAAYAPHFANLAYRLWRAGDADDAAEALDEALTLDPRLASAWLTLGTVKLSQGELEEGDRCLAEAIDLGTKAASAHYLRGLAAKRVGRREEAAEHFVGCLEMNPAHREASAELRELAAREDGDDPAARRARQALARANRSADSGPVDSGPVRATLSACLIVKDEEESLARCLGSLQSVADQVVVVDTGSKDGTVAVARDSGAEVYHLEWRDDFAAARNAAIARATCDWVLIVDADEELPAESADQLRELLANPVPGLVCHLLTQAPAADATDAAAGLVGHPRLFRSGAGIHFAGIVHEQLVDADGRPIEEVVFTGIPVLHHGYLEPPSAMSKRSERNWRLLQARAEAEPESPAVLFYLGMAQLERGENEHAAATLRRAAELTGSDRGLRVKTVLGLTQALQLAGQWGEVETVLRAALADQPGHPELLCALGRELERQPRTAEAIATYRAAVRGRFGTKMECQDFTCRDVEPRSRLAAIFLARGEATSAAAEAKAGLAIRPEATQLRSLLASALLSAGERQAARAELDIVLAENPEYAGAHNNLGVCLALEGRHREAVREFETALAFKPDDMDALCNLAMSRHAQGDFAGAQHAWEEALKRKSSHVPAWLGLARTYLENGAYQAGAKCYEMAALHGGHSAEVMAEIAEARSELRRMAAREAAREEAE